MLDKYAQITITELCFEEFHYISDMIFLLYYNIFYYITSYFTIRRVSKGNNIFIPQIHLAYFFYFIVFETFICRLLFALLTLLLKRFPSYVIFLVIMCVSFLVNLKTVNACLYCFSVLLFLTKVYLLITNILSNKTIFPYYIAMRCSIKYCW